MELTPKQDFDGKWGFVDESGVWQVTPLYDSVEPFEGDYAKGVVDGHHMFIDKEGRWFKERPKGERPEEEDMFFDHTTYTSPIDILEEGLGNMSKVFHKGLNKCK